MNTTSKVAVSLLLSLAAVTVCAAKDKQQAAPTAHPASSGEPLLRATFSTAETQAIRTYYSNSGEQGGKHGKPLPPGLQKKLARGGQLPPGWQKKVARGEVLPPDIYSQAKPAPTVLIQQLPPQPPGTVIVQLDGKIVRLAQATREIIDILDLW